MSSNTLEDSNLLSPGYISLNDKSNEYVKPDANLVDSHNNDRLKETNFGISNTVHFPTTTSYIENMNKAGISGEETEQTPSLMQTTNKKNGDEMASQLHMPNNTDDHNISVSSNMSDHRTKTLPDADTIVEQKNPSLSPLSRSKNDESQQEIERLNPFAITTSDEKFAEYIENSMKSTTFTISSLTSTTLHDEKEIRSGITEDNTAFKFSLEPQTTAPHLNFEEGRLHFRSRSPVNDPFPDDISDDVFVEDRLLADDSSSDTDKDDDNDDADSEDEFIHIEKPPSPIYDTTSPKDLTKNNSDTNKESNAFFDIFQKMKTFYNQLEEESACIISGKAMSRRTTLKSEKS
ncbi:unnamed protein product [Didymodactylos carnosus]|uniref:Uncharacterized protein n=1 Tax=Didymodactylos carnosus TaxID=1234261 RepID=A0A815BAN7_9BILA|nr:unnamed protein product [Didymodactylos carnosus]CAF1267151.1 unnamed protein product [Didymodactylos carnosus]CAF3710511.1 unnamed protein product [Didymodactylos carnosus]CAF4051393.1 unnamed protein product [Didymodactylos carnosus]